jgi:hypothetical protein
MMFGQKTGCEELVAYLTGESRRMPTDALAKVKLEDWKKVRAGEGSLEWFITPKELAED